MSSQKNDEVVETEKSLKAILMNETVYDHLITWFVYQKIEYSQAFITLSGSAVFNDEHRLPAARVKGQLDAISDVISSLEKLRRK